MSWPPTVRVALASRPDNVAVIREIVAGIADVVELAGGLDDVKIAVSEACNNVVMHAYGSGEGPLEVDLRILPELLEVVVRDHGVGIDPLQASRASETTLGRGLGLVVIAELSDRFELRRLEPHGLEVVMGFTARARSDRLGEGGGTDLADCEWLAAPDGAVHLAIAPPALSAVVLDRVVVVAAARAGFSIDRLSDAQLVADALAAHIVPALSAPRLMFAAKGEQRRLELALGPLKPGGSRTAFAASAIGALGGVIEHLADEVAVSESGSEELLKLILVDQRPTPAGAPA